MIDAQRIDMIIQEGEGLTVEFKEHFSPRIVEDMTAFANTKGGVIILGVRHDKTVGGEELTNDLKARINSLGRNCTPPIQAKIRQVKNLVVIEVPQGDEKPYGCSAGYFRRLDGTTQKMSNHELRMQYPQKNQPKEEAWGGVDKGVDKGVDNLSANEKKIYTLIEKNPFISKGSMAKTGNLTKKTVEYNLEKLKAKGFIKRIGPAKGGHWEIVDG